MRKILTLCVIVFLTSCTNQKNVEVVSGVTHIITAKDIKEAQR